MDAVAVLLSEPERLTLQRLDLSLPGVGDVVVDVEWSGISTGTERLLWAGRMPHFPGLGYPLVPGYETVGRVAMAGAESGRRVGQRVFVPGAACFGPVRGLFGGAASRLVVPGSRAAPIAEELGERGVLLALAATAYHALADGAPPELVVGHGVFGRLLARIAIATGAPPPMVWETNPDRMTGAEGYTVLHPDADPRRDYRAIYDASGDSAILDRLVQRLAPRGEVVLAGFYAEPLHFAFPPAFMREARFRIAAEWQAPDLAAVTRLTGEGRLSLDGLITHRRPAAAAEQAYRTAFGDPGCLKMILEWRTTS